MRQQVTDGCALGPRRFAQIDELLFDGDEGRPRGQRFGYRGQREHRCRVSVGERDVAFCTGDDGVGMVERETGQGEDTGAVGVLGVVVTDLSLPR